MADLPSSPDLDQLRQRAKDLLRAAKRGDADALARLHAVSGQLILDSAQLAMARETASTAGPNSRPRCSGGTSSTAQT